MSSKIDYTIEPSASARLHESSSRNVIRVYPCNSMKLGRVPAVTGSELSNSSLDSNKRFGFEDFQINSPNVTKPTALNSNSPPSFSESECLSPTLSVDLASNPLLAYIADLEALDESNSLGNIVNTAPTTVNKTLHVPQKIMVGTQPESNQFFEKPQWGESNSRPAVTARMHRQKHKTYVTTLENDAARLRQENLILSESNKALRDRMSGMEKDIVSLRATLSAQAEITCMFRSFMSTQKLGRVSKMQSDDDEDDDVSCEPPQKKATRKRKTIPTFSGSDDQPSFKQSKKNLKQPKNLSSRCV